jgi:hypothetical protein
VPRPPGSVALPSGLGAGGRGKEKAPCRYLHFEVDFDGEDDGWERERDKEEVKPKGKPALPIGCGPEGKAARGLVSLGIAIGPQGSSSSSRFFPCKASSSMDKL